MQKIIHESMKYLHTAQYVYSFMSFIQLKTQMKGKDYVNECSLHVMHG